MIANLVTLLRNELRVLGKSFHILAAQKEGGANARLAQYFQDERRGFARPVVKRQRDCFRSRIPANQCPAQPLGGRGRYGVVDCRREDS